MAVCFKVMMSKVRSDVRPELLQIEAEIMFRVHERGAGKTICPSEVARALADEEAIWRSLMAEVRAVAADLAARGDIIVTQKGAPVDALQARGPIRLGLPGSDPSNQR